MTELYYDEISSPLGDILIAADSGSLCVLDFAGCESRMHALLEPRYGKIELTRRPDPNGYSSRIRAYFDGQLNAVDDIPVNGGGTAFQQKVWRALRCIPPGSTASYGQIAARLGQPTAARAVGMANSLNPIAIVVPCHRVIGSNGKLTGYAGGLERKTWLLAHERAAVPQQQSMKW